MASNNKLHFNGSWRSYQQRILDALDVHLRDNRLHIVAAPGAGKTTLGIEVIARLGRPTLVLCPTNTIKQQWRDRICSSFLQEEDYALVSTDIRQPSYITVVTYQALLAAFCGISEDDEAEATTETPAESEEEAEASRLDASSITSSARFSKEKADAAIATLQAAGVSLLCFDEAHHLRKEWWKALTYLNNRLRPQQTLALTATPPYDADGGEWRRYQELCGEIDEVISIPELVKNGDLCPHQDFVYLAPLKESERESLNRHRQNVQTFVETIRSDAALIEILSSLKTFEAAPDDVEAILDAPEFYLAAASLMVSAGRAVPDSFLSLFDLTPRQLPSFNRRQAETFANGFLALTADVLQPLAEKKTEVMHTARRLGLVDRKKIVLGENARIRRCMASSIGKLDAIVDIVGMEFSFIGSDLRMLILADHIKQNDTTGNSLGVVPIWARLKAPYASQLSIGVLCGTLILLPKRAVGSLFLRMEDAGLSPDAVALGDFAGDEDFVRITPKEAIRNHIVGLVTDLFSDGQLNVLVGTHALLGEGWDAPAINALVLSSTVSSYMLSNQMRGRAIRICRSNPDKVANIWHLATIDNPLDDTSTLPYETLTSNDIADLQVFTSDLQQLATRFEGYEAPSYAGKHDIVSGIERVLGHLNPNSLGFWQQVKHRQKKTFELAANREQTRQWWHDGLHLGYDSRRPARLRSGVQVAGDVVRSLRYASAEFYVRAILSLLGFCAFMILSRVAHAPELIFIAIALLALAAGASGIALLKFVRTGSVAGVMKQIAIVVFETLSAQNLIKTSLHRVGLRVTSDDGMFFVSCTNLPVEENNLFIQSLQEFLAPIENPRYVLVRRETFFGRIRQTDYFALPAAIGTNKRSVSIFQKLWEKYIGTCDIVYTRTAEGNRLLLKARRYASSTFQRQLAKRLAKWM